MKTLIFALLFATPAFAASLSDVYVIPAAAHATGAGGELWQTDIALFNPDASLLAVDLVLVDAAGHSTTLGSTVTVAANETKVLRDVAGSGTLGAVVISGNHPFAVTSRAYATTARGTFGQSVVAASEFIDSTTRDAFITGLVSNAASRSNIGFFAAADAGAPLRVTVTLFNSSGSEIGSRSFDVPAGAILSAQFPAYSIASGTFDAVTARATITGGSGIATAYGSVIDNATSDAVFIAGASGVALPTSAAARLRAHFE